MHYGVSRYDQNISKQLPPQQKFLFVKGLPDYLSQKKIYTTRIILKSTYRTFQKCLPDNTMVVSRTRDGFFYFTFGCGLTALYFLFFSSTPTVIQIEEITPSLNLSNNFVGTTTTEGVALNETSRAQFESRSELSRYFKCENVERDRFVEQRGKFYVIYNFVKADLDFGCTGSITLTSPGDFRFLDNVIPLVDRWQGPISIALYAPGHDFFTTISAIAYLRQCHTRLIKDFVSFHVFFETDHMPEMPFNKSSLVNAYEENINCSLPPPWQNFNEETMYKSQNALLYPINVARNVAKLAAKTYFVFPSDIELYPTRRFVPLFLKFVRDNLQLFDTGNSRNVFVLPIFEILENQVVPENKTMLQTMLNKKSAVMFHQTVCAVCHRVIGGEKWVKAPETDGLRVFSVGRREGRHVVWEPFYVCTQKEPLWDERMTWEGQGNKMVQAYTMCLMHYNFHVLDNAFLIHKPGVKKKKVQIMKYGDVVQKSNKLLKEIAVELQHMYGADPNCRTNFYVGPGNKKQ